MDWARLDKLLVSRNEIELNLIRVLFIIMYQGNYSIVSVLCIKNCVCLWPVYYFYALKKD